VERRGNKRLVVMACPSHLHVPLLMKECSTGVYEREDASRVITNGDLGNFMDWM
jgi:hypothetical protein